MPSAAFGASPALLQTADPLFREERYHIAITDMEVHAGAHFRARALLAEAQRRETLRGSAVLPRLEQ